MKKISFSEFIFDKRFRVLRHLLFWIVGAGLFPTFLSSFSFQGLTQVTKVTLCMVPVEMYYTYGILWLVPGFLMKEQYLRMVLFLFAWMVINAVITALVNTYVLSPFLYGVSAGSFTPKMLLNFSWYQLVTTNLIAICAVLFRVFKLWYQELQKKMKAEQDRLKTEMELLQARINPHFLFNTLNNLYTLVYEKSDKAPKMLLHLSDLLSYVLYECKEEKVSLAREIERMKDYVSLERERYGEQLDISFCAHGNMEGWLVTPLLFQPLIENAFKHGMVKAGEKSWMSIEFSLKGNKIHFSVVNSCESSKCRTEKVSGIGLENVRKRLDLFYRDKHRFDYGKEGDMFMVNLEITADKVSENWPGSIPGPVVNTISHES